MMLEVFEIMKIELFLLCGVVELLLLMLACILTWKGVMREETPLQLVGKSVEGTRCMLALMAASICLAVLLLSVALVVQFGKGETAVYFVFGIPAVLGLVVNMSYSWIAAGKAFADTPLSKKSTEG